MPPRSVVWRCSGISSIEVKCAHGIEALRNYRKTWNERLQEFTGVPIHNWASHGADAFRGLATRHDTRGQEAGRIRRVLGDAVERTGVDVMKFRKRAEGDCYVFSKLLFVATNRYAAHRAETRDEQV
jgi:hypothetical protein